MSPRKTKTLIDQKEEPEAASEGGLIMESICIPMHLDAFALSPDCSEGGRELLLISNQTTYLYA
jgi:hypothetical protein